MTKLAARLQAEKAITAHPASLSRVLLKAGLSVGAGDARLGGHSAA